MANDPIKQNGQGSAVECRFRHTPARYAAAQSHAAAIWRVRPVGTSSLSILERSSTLGPACRGGRDFSADHSQDSGGNSSSSSGVFEKHGADHRSHCDTSIGHVPEHAEKAWLSRAARPARFKYTLSISLTVCTIPSLPKPIVFWCPFGSAPSAAF